MSICSPCCPRDPDSLGLRNGEFWDACISQSIMITALGEDSVWLLSVAHGWEQEQHPPMPLVMGKKSRIACAFALLAALAAWAIFRPERPPDPVFRGKALSKWTDEVDPHTGQLTAAASEAIRLMGTNALPYLLRETGTEDSGFMEAVHGLFGSSPPDQLDHHERGVRGFRALGTMGFDCAIQGLTNSDKLIRWGCAAALLEIGKGSNAMIQPLIGRLNDEDANVRAQAAATLGCCSNYPSQVVPSLLKSLNDTNRPVQGAAALSLGRFGDESKMAFPVLLKMLADPDPQLHFFVTNALKAIDPQAAAKAGIR
jgi:hypothetical protein